MEKAHETNYSDKKQSFKPKQSKYIFHSDYNERKWLKTRGKEDYIDFKDDEIQ